MTLVSDIGLQLWRLLRSLSFLCMGMITEVFHGAGIVPEFQIKLKNNQMVSNAL